MKEAYLFLIVMIATLAMTSIPNALCYPPAGSDYMGYTIATIDLEITGYFSEQITARGPTDVSRGNPYNPGDGRMKIDTEIISMNLGGYSIHIGSIKVVESPSKASTGAIRQRTAGIDFPADSFFDVFIEIHTELPPPYGILHNDDPKHMSAVITSIPPYGSTYENVTSIPLKNEAEEPIGFMLATRHKVEYYVGGVVVPMNKLALIAPWIGLTAVALGTGVATTIYIKHQKRKQ